MTRRAGRAGPAGPAGPAGRPALIKLLIKVLINQPGGPAHPKRALFHGFSGEKTRFLIDSFLRQTRFLDVKNAPLIGSFLRQTRLFGRFFRRSKGPNP